MLKEKNTNYLYLSSNNFFPLFFSNSRSMQAHVHPFYPHRSNTDDVVSLSWLSSQSSLSDSGHLPMTAHLSKVPATPIIAPCSYHGDKRRGTARDLPQLCPLCSVTHGPCQSVPVNATLNWQGYTS